ncbi:hypothetical protein BS50DRAFT_571573 [Corynespora cassiicola Philippines]|uniref:Peptidase M43 pregnancy-associated plasma-A domain-containing protein n=1 Tax=Corynespora cassiicola Philippines TaxID=1448308 RepID=A0A2T2NY06_CORCC|nr:hypothetical protein BS50DRAFT_571573 [Corynespora cassiicola Philippines]
MHVISVDGTEEGGNIPDERIDAQINILNEAFKPVGYSFHVVETERIINEQWYYNLRQESTVETEVVTLRKGSNATLNIYTHGTLNDPSIAWATLPMSVDRVQYDGVFQNATSWVGGGAPEFDQGDTLVHEVGHWFGLYHTFSFNCEFSWDYVDDTPFESDTLVLGGCPVGQDSCPDKPGLDSIHNYMAYTSDECRYEFTPGQIQRMREQVARYRRIVYPGIDPDNVPDTGA